MKRIFLVGALALASFAGIAQKKTTTSAIVAFDATTPADALPKAENKAVVASFDTKTGAVAFEATVSNFAFTNERIQNHFNGANYLNSEKFPKMIFKGTLKDAAKINFKKDGKHKGTVTGQLTVKDITKDITVPVEFEIKGGKILATSQFSINLKEYGITGSSIDGGKVSNEPKISVSANF